MTIQKITYVAGQCAQLKLVDGTRIFLETLPECVMIKKMIFGFIPTAKIWEFKFPFYIRTVGEAWDIAKEILDLVIKSIEGCKTVEDLKQRLSRETTILLNKYIEENQVRAYQIGIEKLGSFAAKKYLQSSQWMKDTLAIPGETMDIIGDFGKVIEDFPKGKIYRPISILPHPKENIENALNTALGIAKDEQMIKHLKGGKVALRTFIPENEVEWANRDSIIPCESCEKPIPKDTKAISSQTDDGLALVPICPACGRLQRPFIIKDGKINFVTFTEEEMATLQKMFDSKHHKK